MTLALLGALVITRGSWSPSPSAPGVSLTFIGYTNQTHTNTMAEVTFAVALLQITNASPSPVKVRPSYPANMIQRTRRQTETGMDFKSVDIRTIPAVLNLGTSAIIHAPMHHTKEPWYTEIAYQRWGRMELWSAAVMSSLPGFLQSMLAQYRHPAQLTKVAFGPETNLPPQPIVRFLEGSPYAMLALWASNSISMHRLRTNATPTRWLPSPDVIDGLRFD